MSDLIDRLKEHKEWAEANIWEVPITLPDDLEEAIVLLRWLANQTIEGVNNDK